MIIGSDFIFIENLTSTNTYATGMLKYNRPADGTIVYSDFQHGGRGQKGNKWESETGKNLLFSIILYPYTIDPAYQFSISKALSLGLTDFLDKYVTGVHIKWPNDIYVNNDKIAGLLIENSLMSNRIESCVAGIGLNINQKIFLSDAPNPVSLALITGKEYDIRECMTGVASRLDMRYKQLLEKRNSEIDNDYLLKLYRFRELHEYRSGMKTFRGRIVSVSEGGLLQIEDEKGITGEYSFKEIEFIQ